jgi:hypothetical protein
MSKPTLTGALTRTVDDPKAPVGLRVRALESIQHPQIAMLLRIMRHPKTPPKLRALASLAYASEVKRRAKEKNTKMQKHPTNSLGLKS